MVLESFAVHTMNGLFFGFILFMVSAGLTVILGVLGILNLTHGELYAFGAYVAVSVLGFIFATIAPAPSGALNLLIFVSLFIVGGIIVALVLVPFGAILEALFVRPIYGRHEVYELLLTFALLLIIIDIIRAIWGGFPRRVTGIYSGINAIPTTEFFGLVYPTYNLVVMVVGIGLFLLMIWFFERTRTGRIIRATAINREMATAIGVSTDRVFTLVFALGAMVAGFAGAMAIPPIATDLEMGVNILILSFVVIVIGGLGSIKGALVASLLVGVISRWATWMYSPIELAAPFAIMAIVLLLRPEGLFGTWGELE